MAYPCLVPKQYCKTKCDIILYEEGITEDGEPIEISIQNLTCNFQDEAKTVLTAEQKLIQLSGTCLFTGDIAPELSNITGGTININGETRDIYKGRKARNPDGSVNFTEIELK